MTPYAHTAVLPNGTSNRDHTTWQPLHTGDPDRPGHLEAVAALAAKFASPNSAEK